MWSAGRMMWFIWKPYFYPWHATILSRATFPGAPSYGGVITWVEGSQTCGDRALAEATNLLGYEEYKTLIQCLEQ